MTDATTTTKNAAKDKHGGPVPGEPVLAEATLHACRPNEPTIGRVTKNEVCTAAGGKSAGFVRHLEIDVSGTPLAGACLAGQSIGVLAPGEDDRGRAHRPRLYSLANPTGGETGDGTILSTTVKRTIDEHWETGELFLGVASNYLCDLRVGDEVKLSGPNGKRFVLPADTSAHDYIFFATGTGIAPFRGFVKELLAKNEASRVVLVMGSPYSTDLIYHDEFLALERDHERFTYLTAISREGGERTYVQDRLATHAALFTPLLESRRTLMYVCGIAGMEVGILRHLARTLTGETLAQYMSIEPEAMEDMDAWTSRTINRGVKTTRRVMLEVYA